MADEYAFEREDGLEIATAGKHGRVATGDEETKIAQPKSTQVAVNLNCDPGCLLVEDCQSFENISAKEFSKRTAANLCTLYKQLFDIKKSQQNIGYMVYLIYDSITILKLPRYRFLQT